MKNLKRIHATILLLASAVYCMAITYPSSSYEISNGNLMKWTGPETEIDFTADPYLLENVEEIWDYAFAGNSTLQSITLSSTIDYIQIYAFQNCSALETVQFSKTGEGRELIIDEGAFRFCSKLRSVTFSPYIKKVWEGAFEGCTSLVSFSVRNHPSWIASDGVIFNSDRTQVVLFPPGATGHFDVPDRVTSIGYAAFAYSNLSSIYLSPNLTSIGESAFYKAKNLTTVNFPIGLRSIDKYAFHSCSSLKSLIFPSTLESIGSWAFGRCHSLPETVKLPSSLVTIDGGAFYDIPSVKRFEVADGNPYYSTIDGVIFDKYGCELVAWPSGKDTVEYIIPEGTTTIREYAFHYANLTSVVFPSTLTAIQESAFSFCKIKSVVLPEGTSQIDHAFNCCDSIQCIELPSTLSSFGRYTFRRYDTLRPRTVISHMLSPVGEWLSEEVIVDTLYVPEESIDLYRMAPGWRDFGAILPISTVQYYPVVFNQAEHGIIIVSANGDEIESGEIIEDGSTITVVAIPIPYSEYTIESLTVNGVSIDNNSSFTLNEPVTIEARFISYEELNIKPSFKSGIPISYDLSGRKCNTLELPGTKKIHLTPGPDGRMHKTLILTP